MSVLYIDISNEPGLATLYAYLRNGDQYWLDPVQAGNGALGNGVLESFDSARYDLYITGHFLNEVSPGNGDYQGLISTTGIPDGFYQRVVKQINNPDGVTTDPTDDTVDVETVYLKDGLIMASPSYVDSLLSVMISTSGGQPAFSALALRFTPITLSGEGDIAVDHNYGGADVMLVEHGGVPLDGAIIRSYPAADYDAGVMDPKPPTQFTGSDGRWIGPLMLDPDNYVLTISHPTIVTKVVRILVS